MSINQITKVRLADGTEVALTDWSSRPIYSTVDLLSGFIDEEIRAFSYIESEQVAASQNLITAGGTRNATQTDTNIDSKGELAATEEYLVYAIQVEMHQFDFATPDFNITAPGLPCPTGPVVCQAQQRLVLELEVSEKAFPQAGLGWFSTGFGPQIVSTDAAVTHRTYANNGRPTREAVYEQPIPVHLGGTEDYSVIIHNSGGGAVNFTDDAGVVQAAIALRMRIYLCGLHKRPTA
jgi:hypothetical protein